MDNPSDAVLPSVIQDSEPLNNLMTSNWRDNGYREDKSLMTQFIALMMLAGYGYCGTELVSSGTNAMIGASTLVYAGSGLLGYFGIGSAPLAVFARANIMSVILAGCGVVSILTSGMTDYILLLLTMMHMADAMMGATNNEPTMIEQDYNNAGTTRETAGPIARFFLDSWKSEAFSRKNYFHCQVFQLIMMGIQLFLAIICLFGGGASTTVMLSFIGFILASVYSYFSPVRLTGVDAIQSNGAQLALLGACTYQIVMGDPSASFLILFTMLALDAFMSLNQFFSENQNVVVRSSISQMGLLQKDDSYGETRRVQR